MTLRLAATLLFALIVFIVPAMATGLISANVRKLADKHGWDNFLVRWTERLSWERVRGLWWLWAIFGLSGGVALVLWLSLLVGQPATPTAPLAPLIASPNPVHDAATKWKLAQNLHIFLIILQDYRAIVRL